MAKGNNYLKNVINSVAYAAADVTEQYTPSMKEFTSTNKEFATATYALLRNPAATVKRSVQAIQDSKIYKALDYGAKNLSEDLRTGKFYNRERKERDELSLSGMSADDWNDLSEYGIDDNWENELKSSKSKVKDEITSGDLDIIESIEGSNAAVASATVNAVISSSKSEIKNNRANTATLYMQNERLFGGLHKDITVLGSTMQQMYKLQEGSLQNIDKNMSDFFTQESKLNTERNAILKEMLELQRSVYRSAADKERDANGKKRSNRIRWNDINVNGMPDLGSYFEAIKKNINNELSTIMPAGFSEDSNMLATFMISPLEGVMKYVVDGVIPATVKAAAKQLDSTISGVFGTLIGRMGNARANNQGGILGLIGKFLGISTSVNRNIDTSKYEKGPVPFDGLTRKAIIDVIPTHLRRIEAAITGKPEQIFDYKSGRWIDAQSAKKQYDDIKKSAVNRGTSEIIEAMNPGIQAIRKGIDNKVDLDSWDLAVEEFRLFLYNNNGYFNPKASASKNGINAANYSNLYRHYNKIQAIYKDFDTISSKYRNGNIAERHVGNHIRMNVASNVMSAKDSEDAQYRSIETDVGNVLQTIAGMSTKNIDNHGKYDKDTKVFTAHNILKDTTDKLGNTIFDYLKNINKELVWFRKNGLPGGGGTINPDSDQRVDQTTMDDIEKEISKNKASSNSKEEKRARENETIKNRALQAISSGKAVDLREFSNDEKSYLLRLKSMISDNAVEQYRDEISGYNSNEISKFIDKNLIKTNIKSLKDIEDATRKAERESKNTSDTAPMTEKEEGFFKKILKRVGGEGILGGIVGASTEAFTNLLYAADRAIYDMMFKAEIDNDDDENNTNKKKYNGFMEAMVGTMKDKFKSFSEWFKTDILEPFKEKFNIGDDFKDRFTNTLKDAGSKLWTAFKDANLSVYKPVYDATIGKVQENAEKKQIAKNLREKYSGKYERQEAFNGEYKPFKGKLAVYKKLKEIGVSEDEIREVRDNCMLADGVLNENKYINDLNELYKSKISKARYTKKESSDSLATKGRRKSRNMALTSLQRPDLFQDKPNLFENWQKKNFNFNSENEIENALLTLGISREHIDKIKYNSYTDGILDLNLFKQNATKTYLRHLNKFHAVGTPSGKPFTGLTTLTKGEGLISGKGVGVVPKTGVYNIDTPTHIINRKDMGTLQGRNLSNASIQNDLGKEKLAAKREGFNISHHEAGTMRIVNNNGVNIEGEELIAEAKKNIPEGAAGGLIGAIVSTILGLAGGPIVGAALGVGGSIIAKSDLLKDKLFGKIGEDGKRKGTGIISKTVIDKFNKTFPDMAKYGLAGIIPGLITGIGPIGGLMIGGAFGYLKNNEKFTNKYFGEEGALHIKTKEKEIIEKMLPGALKGAGAGIVSTLFLSSQFGLLGNAAIGAGIGMMATTEDFKNLILGEEIDGERVGGIVGIFKDALDPIAEAMKNAGQKIVDAFEKHLINPLSNFIHPAINALPIMLGTLPRMIADKIDSYFNGRIGRTVETWVSNIFTSTPAKMLGGIFKGATSIATMPLRLPGKILNAAGDKLREYDINHGNLVDMDTKEAVAFLRGKDKRVNSLLETAAKVGSGEKNSLNKDEAQLLAENLDRMNDTQKSAKKNFSEKNKALNRYLNSYRIDGKKLSNKQIKSILEAVNSGNHARVGDILQKYHLEGSSVGMTKEQFNAFMNDGLKDRIADAVDAQKRVKNIDTIKDSDAGRTVTNLLLKAGIKPEDFNINNAKDRKRLAALLKDKDIELEAHPEKIQQRLETENNQNLSTIKDAVVNMLNMMVAESEGTSEGVKKARKNAEDLIETSRRNANRRYDKNTEKAINRLSDEDKEKLEQDTEGKYDDAKDAMSVKKNRRRVSRYGLDFIKAAGSSDLKPFDKIFARNKKLIPLCKQNAIEKVNTLTNYEISQLSKNLKNPHIKAVLIDGNYNITEETITLLSGGDIRSVIENCIFLDQIHRKTKSGEVYRKYNSFEEAVSIGYNEIYDLQERYGINYTNSTSSIITDLKRNNKEEFGYTVDAFKTLRKASFKVAGGVVKTPFKIANAAARNTYKLNTHSNRWHVRHDKRAGGAPDDAADQTNNDQSTDENTTETNALGTVLLGGLSKIGSGIVSAGKAIGSGAKSIFGSLFNKKKSADGSGLFPMMPMLNMGGGFSPMSGAAIPMGSTDEIDKPNDGKEYMHVGDGQIIEVSKKSDGSVEPNTSDSKTKAIMNKIFNKEKAAEKLHAAQAKASELIHNTFDTSKFKESAGGKIGWLEMLIMGGFLVKSGILKKVFDGVVKPVWTNHIKPWITDTAIPWISDKWNNHIKPWIFDKAIPKIGQVVGEVINVVMTDLPNILATVLGKTIRQLPSLIVTAVKAALGFADGVTSNNKHNVGAVTTVSSENIAAQFGSGYTEFYDENGNRLTGEDIANHNYQKIFNGQGAEGTVDEYGNIQFKDESKVGTAYGLDAAKVSFRQFFRTIATGKTSKILKAVNDAGGHLLKRKGLLAKATGAAAKLVTLPATFAEKTAMQLLKKDTVKEVIEAAAKDADNAAKEVAKGASKAAKTAAENVDKVIADTAKNADDVAKAALKEAGEETVEVGAKEAGQEAAETIVKSKGFAKVLSKLVKGIDNLFSNNKVVKKLAEGAQWLGKQDAVTWIKNIKSKITSLFTKSAKEAIEQTAREAGESAAKEAVKTATKVSPLTIVFLVTDFISGCDKAESILGVSDTNILEEIIAGLINALFGLVPFLQLLAPAVMKGLWSIFDFKGSFKQRQEEAKAELKQYNDKTGKTLSLEEYLTQKKSWSGKIWSGIKSIPGGLWKTTKSVAGGISSGAKWVASGIGSLFSNAEGTISSSNLLASNPATLLDVYNNSNDLIGNMDKDFNFKELNKTMDKVKEGKISIFSKEYWKQPNTNDGTLKGTLENSYTMLMKIVNLPMLMIKDSLSLLTGDIEEIGNGITDTESSNKTKTKTTIGSKIKNVFVGLINKAKDFFGYGEDTHQYGTGKYSKQIDPSVSGIRFNASGDTEYQTIGDSACGPAAAVNAIESMYGRGNSLASAAKYAISRGYKETNGGTKPGFFADYFSKNGYKSQTTYNKSELMRNIMSGAPTVIMGQDAKGVSSSTPFGKSPHYVTITGTDGRGNAIVQDPESRYDNQLYPLSSLMKNTSFGVSAFGRGKWGRGDYDEQIWWYLKNNMKLTDAGAAGLMGNLYAESGLMPNNAENEVNEYTNMTDEEYTAAVNNGTIDKNKFLHPKGDDKVFGYGLAQWTSVGRKEGMYNHLMTTKGRIDDLAGQLEWLDHELKTGYREVLDVLTTTNKLSDASNIVLQKYEKPADQSYDKKMKRQEFSQTYLEKFTGKSGQSFGTVANNPDIIDPVADEYKSNISGILDALSVFGNSFTEDTFKNNKVSQSYNLFTDLLNKFLGTSFTLTKDKDTAINLPQSVSTDTINNTNTNNNVTPSTDSNENIQRVINIARGELGNTDPGINGNDYNDWYFNRKGDSNAWCAAFVSWVANQAGLLDSTIPKYAYTPDGYDALRTTYGKEVDKTQAKAGDILFVYHPDKGRIAHTGIVTGMDGDNVLSIEGNWGNKVAEVRRGPDKNAQEYANLRITRPNYGTGTYNKPLSKFGQFKESIYSNYRLTEPTDFDDRRIIPRPKKVKNSNDNNITNTKYGKGNTNIDYSKLISSIISILMKIADNTDKLNLIVTILNEKLNLNISASDVSNATNDSQSLKSKLAYALNGINTKSSKFNTYADNVSDSSMNYIISAMNAIASE